MFENREQLKKRLQDFISSKSPNKVLLVPPDHSRAHSGGGLITAIFYEIFTKAGIQADILPAIGAHFPMNRAEQLSFFGDIPEERFLVHRWRDGVVKIGEIPAELVQELSEGQVNEAIPVELSKHLLDPSYDLIISIGQVVPHEVVGMANYTKNIVVGCGGSRFINASHMIGAFYGIERILGQIDTPVRRIFDYAEENFLTRLPLEYVLTVTEDGNITKLYTGRSRSLFEEAAAQSQKQNITYLENPIQKCIVYLDKDEFRSTWIGNKAIYRTRMAMAKGGHLIILAPGIRTFGEDPENDRLIRKYGYCGRTKILKLCKTNPDLKNNLSAAAHLIHGSSEGHFKITYAAPILGQEAIESVGYQYMDWPQAKKLQAKPNNKDHHYIPNPAQGLWQIK